MAEATCRAHWNKLITLWVLNELHLILCNYYLMLVSHQLIWHLHAEERVEDAYLLDESLLILLEQQREKKHKQKQMARYVNCLLLILQSEQSIKSDFKGSWLAILQLKNEGNVFLCKFPKMPFTKCSISQPQLSAQRKNVWLNKCVQCKGQTFDLHAYHKVQC